MNYRSLLRFLWFPPIAAITVMIATFTMPSQSLGQQLNQRHDAPPGASAKKARVLTEARSQAAQRSEDALNKSTVNTDCSPVEIGNQDLSGDKPKISGHDDQVVVVPGDIINICR